MSATRAAFIHSSELERYSYPSDCPFRSERAARLRELLASMGLLSGPQQQVEAFQAAPREVLETFHTSEYLDILEDASQGHMDVQGLWMGLGTEDCPVFRGMYAYSALAAGASIKAAELIAAGAADVAFNPSGGYHHAHPDRAGGFCYINDVVLACLRLRQELQRVLFIDIDAHHCDGVEAAFAERRDVMTVSLHETGKLLFPGTGFPEDIGSGEGAGYSVNVPLPPGTYDEAYLDAFRQIVCPLMEAYGPSAVVMEIGMDCLAGDPLAHLSLTNNACAEAVRLVRSFGRPVLAVGGGGYHVDNCVRGWALCWSVLCGAEQRQEDLSLGLGGVMLGSADWQGGLRDRAKPPGPEQRGLVDRELAETVEKVKRLVFPRHGI